VERPERLDEQQVLALAPDRASVLAARALAAPSLWSAAGTDDGSVWGRYVGAAGEPYDVVAHLADDGAAFACSCPSRKQPCKHAIGLLLLWADGNVPTAPPPAFASSALTRLARRPTAQADGGAARPAERAAGGAPSPPSGGPDARAVERAERVRAGLDELDRWLADQVRVGLTAPHLARYATWDRVAARLVDAQCGSLANRVRRVGGVVGSGSGWYERVLDEMGSLHVLAVAGRRLPSLSPDAGAAVRQALGMPARRDDVLASAPVTDQWLIAGRGDTDEDRILVRRTYLWGLATRRWVMVLSFAAFGQALDESLVPGEVLHADVHLYPGALGLRALVGQVHQPATPADAVPAPQSLTGALAARGQALAAEPWLERWPVCLCAAPAPSGPAWVLADHEGSLPLAEPRSLPTLLAVSAGAPVVITAELVAGGVVPLTLHLDGRTVTL